MMDKYLDVDVVMTRRAVAREELDTAIDIILSDGSMIAAHVLASAASEILKAVGLEKGISTISAQMDTMIRPDKKKEFYAAFRAHYNFAKHADKDPTAEKQFRPRIAIMTLFQAIAEYQLIYGIVSLPMLLFLAWSSLDNKDLFVDDHHPIIDRTSELFQGDHSLSKLKSLYATYIENRAILLGNMPEELKAKVEI